MNIGEKLIKLRKEKNISQEKLSNKLGITRQTLSNWESNITSPNLEQAKKLAELFNISIDELVDNHTTLILNKINNTENLVVKQTKFTKVILLTIYTIIIGLLLIYSFKMFTKKDFTSKYSTNFKCTLNNETTNFTINYSGKHTGCVDNFGNTLEECNYTEQEETYYLIISNQEEQESLKIGTSLYETFKSLEYAKGYYLNHGAICVDNKD